MMLGICVVNPGNMEHVVGLAKAAKAAGKEVRIFFTGDGVAVTQDPRMNELVGVAKMTLCETSFDARGLKGKPVPGFGFKDFATQEKNAEMVERCDRYVVL
jgi:sulfur relay (sulfurtransferase) complex TusBCD TusD component (DsrE family)